MLFPLAATIPPPLFLRLFDIEPAYKNELLKPIVYFNVDLKWWNFCVFQFFKIFLCLGFIY